MNAQEPSEALPRQEAPTTPAEPGVGASAARWFESMLSPPAEASRTFVCWAWRYLLLHLTFRYAKTILISQAVDAAQWLCLVLTGSALLLTFVRLPARTSKGLALASACLEMAWRFPVNSNHSYVEFFLLFAFVVTDFESADQRPLLVAAGRWFLTLLMLHSGLQKLLHGTYFDGMYLATLVNSKDVDNFRALFQATLERNEFEALVRALDAGEPGPYRFHGPAGLIISNSVYLAELAVAALLLWPRTRRLGALAGMVMLLGIEAVAMEWTFGLLALNLFALFLPLRWRTGAALISAAAYLVLLVVQASIGKSAQFFI